MRPPSAGSCDGRAVKDSAAFDKRPHRVYVFKRKGTQNMTTEHETPTPKRSPGLAKGKELVNAPLSKLREKEGFNVRLAYDEDSIEGLGKSIEAQGLNEPIPVVRDPEDADGFIIVGAFTRFRAMKARGLRGTVPCIVHEFKTAWGPAVLNMTGNTAVTALHTADLAKRLHEFETGTYPVLPGETAQPMSRKDICAAVGLGTSYVGNLIRAWKKLCEPVRAEWIARRGKDAIPTDVINLWATYDEEGQIAALEKWVKKQDKPKKDKKGGGDGDGEGAAAKVQPVSRGELRKKLETFREKLENGPALKGVDLERAQAKVEALRWAAGEISRLPMT